MRYRIKNVFALLNKVSDKVLNITVAILLVIMFVWFAYTLIVKYIFCCATLSFNPFVLQVFKYVCLLLLILFLCAVAVHIFSSIFLFDDKENEFDDSDNDKLLKSSTKIQASSARLSVPESILCGLTPEQETIICQMLQAIPSHYQKADHINMAYVAQFLKALYELGYLNNVGDFALKKWVESVTGKCIPSSSAFNEAYRDANHKKTQKIKQTIQDRLA